MTAILTVLGRPFFRKGNGGPWGPKSGKDESKPSSHNQQKELDDMLRQAQDRMRDMMGAGQGNGRPPHSDGNLPLNTLFSFILLALLGVWLYLSFYIVKPDEQGVVTRFGAYVQTTGEGLHFRLWPIEDVIKPKVTRENIVEVGFRSSGALNALRPFRNRTFKNGQVVDVSPESLMLTGDENIVDLDFTVRWKIAEPKSFLFNVAFPVETLKHVSESAMREVVGRYPIDAAITEDKDKIQREALKLIQEVADGYGLGIKVNGVELQQVQPPKEVLDAFRDVQAAKADAEKEKNKATGYANDIVPRARGEAAQIMQEAEAYKASKIAEAEGNAGRFLSQLKEYRKAKEITKKRLYLETMEDVLRTNKKVILSKDAGQGVLPYLPLDRNGRVK